MNQFHSVRVALVYKALVIVTLVHAAFVISLVSITMWCMLQLFFCHLFLQQCGACSNCYFPTCFYNSVVHAAIAIFSLVTVAVWCMQQLLFSHLFLQQCGACSNCCFLTCYCSSVVHVVIAIFSLVTVAVWCM